MPCWQRQETRIDLKNIDFDVMKDALEELGYDAIKHDYGVTASRNGMSKVQVTRNGVTIYDDDIQQNAVRKAYSNAAVKRVAKRFGWTQKKQGENKVVLTRRAG